MKHKQVYSGLHCGLIVMVVVLMFNKTVFSQVGSMINYGQLALKESVIPVRLGIPEVLPFRNQSSRQFIYAPTFDFKTVSGADTYRYKLIDADNKIHIFETNIPHSPLSKVWLSIPTGFFNLTVSALNSKGDSIGLAGSGKYYKAAFLNGPYQDISNIK